MAMLQRLLNFGRGPNEGTAQAIDPEENEEREVLRQRSEAILGRLDAKKRRAREAELQRRSAQQEQLKASRDADSDASAAERIQPVVQSDPGEIDGDAYDVLSHGEAEPRNASDLAPEDDAAGQVRDHSAGTAEAEAPQAEAESKQASSSWEDQLAEDIPAAFEQDDAAHDPRSTDEPLFKGGQDAEPVPREDVAIQADETVSGEPDAQDESDDALRLPTNAGAARVEAATEQDILPPDEVEDSAAAGEPEDPEASFETEPEPESGSDENTVFREMEEPDTGHADGHQAGEGADSQPLFGGQQPSEAAGDVSSVAETEEEAQLLKRKAEEARARIAKRLEDDGEGDGAPRADLGADVPPVDYDPPRD